MVAQGAVCVGVSHDTPAFAAHSIATWWKREGSCCYGCTPKLLVLADSGGSNSGTSWLWKIELQSQVCNPFGISVTIAHYPTGASQWNPIEHRLFSEISKNWAAEPLDSYEKMLKYIRTSDTQTGLVVTAYLDRNEYSTRLKPDPQLVSSLRLVRGKVLPKWNYTNSPESVKLFAPPLSLRVVDGLECPKRCKMRRAVAKSDPCFCISRRCSLGFR